MRRSPPTARAALALVCVVAGAVYGVAAAGKRASPSPDCTCTLQYAPVCGKDGVTYGNACQLGCAGVEKAYDGPCADPFGCAAVTCPAGGQPVCGNDGVTYPNACNAECTGVYIAHVGKCKPAGGKKSTTSQTGTGKRKLPKGSDCFCTLQYDPVCGTDGKTYGNACQLGCSKAKFAYAGPCADPSGCAAVLCSNIHDPVCGYNNVTYPNECQASCTGVWIQYAGECGSPTPGASPYPNGASVTPDDSTVTTSENDPGCVCTLQYAPVCGKDGVTYGNACQLGCAGVEKAYDGPCADPFGCAAVTCPAGGDPVCGNDGVTYPNACNAGCTGVWFKNGTCGSTTPSCTCPRKRSPVCGKDGVTYGNRCLMRCAGAKFDYEGGCENPSGCDNVRCSNEGGPVCGANGKEYPNQCIATCSGVNFTPGPCKPKKGKAGQGTRRLLAGAFTTA